MDVDEPDRTFPQLLDALAGRHGDDRVAMQEKRYGIWQPITWREYRDRVGDFAHGLAALGVEAGEIVAVLGDNRPEWLIAELAAQSLGAAVVGIYPSSVGDEIVHIVTAAQARIVIAEDQEQVDKLLELSDRIPRVEAIVYYDPHGLELYDEPLLVFFPDLEHRGRAYAADRAGWLDEQIAAARPDDVAVICTTSGTTSKPKLAMLSHSNLLTMGRRLMELDPLEEDGRYVSFLPLAWIGEQMLALAYGLQAGMTISFPERAGTVKSDMREIGPDVLFGPPRIWESMLSDVQVRLGESGWVKRRSFELGHRIGDRVTRKRVAGEKVRAGERVLHALADVVALRPVRDQLGLTRVKRCYTGGAPLGPDLFRFFHTIGVNLKQIYGQTEICGIAVCHRDDDLKFSSVGVPLPGTELRIGEDGEIQLRSDAVFKGYYRNETATREVLDDDGWLHTGDAGYLDDDEHLVVIDRANDVMRTSDGTMFSPAFIENKLKFSPHVEEAVVFGGDERDEITAMITIDMESVGAWAERNRLPYTTYTDLAQKHPVYELVADAVDRANEDLEKAIRVQRFVLLHKQLDPDDDEITRTRKVRRRIINQRYRDIIEALSRGEDSVSISSTVTYQDGTTVERQIDLAIFSMASLTRRARNGRGMAWRAK